MTVPLLLLAGVPQCGLASYEAGDRPCSIAAGWVGATEYLRFHGSAAQAARVQWLGVPSGRKIGAQSTLDQSQKDRAMALGAIAHEMTEDELELGTALPTLPRGEPPTSTKFPRVGRPYMFGMIPGQSSTNPNPRANERQLDALCGIGMQMSHSHMRTVNFSNYDVQSGLSIHAHRLLGKSRAISAISDWTRFGPRVRRTSSWSIQTLSDSQLGWVTAVFRFMFEWRQAILLTAHGSLGAYPPSR